MTQNNGNMNQENQEEMLLSFGRSLTPYTVPQGYFEAFAEGVLDHLRIEAYPKTSVYAVPDGYFDAFADNLLHKVKLEDKRSEEGAQDTSLLTDELRDIAPLLATLARTNVYAVPEGYFDNFEIKNPDAQVVSLHEERFVNKKNIWKGLVVAACLLVFVFAISLFTSKKENVKMAVVPVENTNSKYTAAANIAIDSSNPNMQSTKNYLNSPNSQSESGSVKYIEPRKLNVINVSQEINYISSSDLEEYLNNTPAIN